jgi:hypothetical protein
VARGEYLPARPRRPQAADRKRGVQPRAPAVVAGRPRRTRGGGREAAHGPGHVDRVGRAVWPHDNAIMADGFLRYGCREAAWQIARGLFDAADRFQYYRLPEVFAGLERDAAGFPVQYQGANVPQAWASGSLVHMVAAMLGFTPDAACQRLTISPALPPWLPNVTVSGLRVGQAQVDLQLSAAGVQSEVRGRLELTTLRR